jgi:hypothetical protein
MKSGRLNKCRECCKKSAKESREKNLEVVRAYDRVRSKSPERKLKRKIYQSGKGKELANARKGNTQKGILRERRLTLL